MWGDSRGEREGKAREEDENEREMEKEYGMAHMVSQRDKERERAVGGGPGLTCGERACDRRVARPARNTSLFPLDVL